MPYSIADLNQMNQADFVEALGAVFEETPTIAQEAWNYRPFADATALHRCMVGIMQSGSPEAQLALIKAHPDLGSKTQMAEASVEEQAGVGLDRLTPAEFDRFQALNQAYKEKFGFPFIVAVKNQTKTIILEAFQQRLQNSIETEQQQALSEIAKISWLRLSAQVATD